MITAQLSNLDIVENNLPFGQVDCVYCDLPWGSGRLKHFRSLSKRPDVTIDWGKFLSRFFDICILHCSKGTWFVEIGPRFVFDVIKNSPRKVSITYKYRYWTGKVHLSSILLVFGDVILLPSIDTTSGIGRIGLVSAVLSNMKKGSSVLDPCCGSGLTARACLRWGLRFFGNELDSERLKQTAAILGIGNAED